MFRTCWPMQLDPYCRFMSENYRLYRQKMAQQRVARRDGSLGRQLMEILDVVRACELRWALERS